MFNNMFPIGYDAEYRTEISIDMYKTGHICIVGGTGSGKSMCVLYILWKLLSTSIPVQLFICDFKKSGDYIGLSSNYAEFDEVTKLIENFYENFLVTPENNEGVKILLIDEYAGYITWLTQTDKKKADDIKGKIANILMLGRSRHCFVWAIQQRMTATLFPAGIGAIDNFQVCIGLGRLSPESRKSLFAGEWLENTEFADSFVPLQGQGLILVDGSPLRPFAVPHISDKEKLKFLLRQLASKRCI